MSGSRRPASALGPLERRVMEVLWAHEPAAPAEMLAYLNQGASRLLAYTTVATVLVRLADKGYVGRRADGRRFLYHSLVEPEMLDSIVGRRELDRLLRRYGADNVARFAADLMPVEHELVERLRALADEEESP